MMDLKEIRTVYKDGAWHFKNNVRRDNIGDFTVGVAVFGDRRFYVLMARMGTPPPGGALWWSPYDGDPWSGWTQGAPPGSMPQPPIKGLPGPEGSINIDTHCWVQNPGTQVITWVHAVRDGRTRRYHTERATSKRLDPNPSAYTRYNYPISGDGENSIVIDPYEHIAVLFSVRKTTEEPDEFGMRFRSRLYRREVELEDFDTEFTVGPDEMVFEPSQDGQTEGAWGQGNGVMQPGICILPGGRYLCARLGRAPFKLASGRPAKGQMNKTTAVGLLTSYDQGQSWKVGEGAPELSREFLGLNEVGNPVNSPHPWFDPFANGGRGQLYFAAQIGGPRGCNKPGSRLMMTELGEIT